MNEQSKITLVELIILLRRRVLTAQNENNIKHIGELHIVFDIISELAAEVGDVNIAALLEDMACTTRDIWTGTNWKTKMPSVEDIKRAITAP